jgi:hypothetical protein
MRSTAVAVILAAIFSSPIVATTPPRYQRVLVPLSVADLAGANASVWTTELWAVNASSQPMELPSLPCIVGVATQCADSPSVPPNRTVKLAPLGNSHFPGVLILVPSELSSSANFTLHVRDLSRQSESWGTEIPVVREQSFFASSTRVSVANIPFGPDYRQTLRIYALDDHGVGARFRVSLYAVESASDRLLQQIEVKLDAPPVPPPNQIGSPLVQLAITEIFAVDAGGADRVRVTIEPIYSSFAPWAYWAFVSITNNKTQQVTTAVPR